jgi:hypothetical protein
MRTQATKATPGQLNYVKHWSHPDNGGHEFPRGAVIPEDISIKPNTWSLPSSTVLAVTAVMLAAVCVILWLNQ